MSTEANPREVEEVDPHSVEFSRNFRELSRCPVAHGSKYGGFSMVNRYEDVRNASRDAATFSSENDVDGTGNGGGGFLLPSSTVRLGILEMDPPEHRQRRSLLTQTITPAAIERYEPRMRELAAERIEAAADATEFDAVEDLGLPFAAWISFEFMGLPRGDWEFFLARLSEHLRVFPDSPEFAAVQARMGEARGRMKEIIGERRATPQKDLFSALAGAEIDGEPLSDEEIIDLAWQMLDAGFDTVGSAIAFSMIALTDHPEVRRRLVEDPALVPGAVEEILRYYSIVTTVGRTATAAIEVAGEALPAGERVMLNLGSANFDPRFWDRPEEFDIDRSPNRHLTFGDGIHKCLGARFTRVAMRVMLEEILRRRAEFTVAVERVEMRPSSCPARGFLAVPAAMGAGSG